jgi:hypothetical protein
MFVRCRCFGLSGGGQFPYDSYHYKRGFQTEGHSREGSYS